MVGGTLENGRLVRQASGRWIGVASWCAIENVWYAGPKPAERQGAELLCLFAFRIYFDNTIYRPVLIGNFGLKIWRLMDLEI